MQKKVRVGLIGAGYIGQWHASALRDNPYAILAAVCDSNSDVSRQLGKRHSVPAFASLNEMLDAGVCEAVHVLTPPTTHFNLATQSLRAGLSVFVEKPAATTSSQVNGILEVAERAGLKVGVGHNFLALPSYSRLKGAVESGKLGRPASVDVSWRLPIAQLRTGPHYAWHLQSEENLLLEFGAHLFAFAVNLFGEVDIEHVSASLPITLPDSRLLHQAYRVCGRAGAVDLNIAMYFVEGPDERVVTVRGSSGVARLDFAKDTLIFQSENTHEIVLNAIAYELSLARQHFVQGWSNASKQILSLNRANPYALSFGEMLRSFYGSPQQVDPRFSAKTAVEVVDAIERTISFLPPAPTPLVRTRRAFKPSVLIVGGTGFIGRHLARKLVSEGLDVRILSRTGVGSQLPEGVEVATSSLSDRDGLRAAMAGIAIVYNLSKSSDTTWEGALSSEVAVSVNIAEAALEAGVDRLIYAGTIASYDMSDRRRVITEETGFNTDMSDRNTYARAKAESEANLFRMHRELGLPLVVMRPGIVLGEGGPLQHWGIGHWYGAGAIKLWGDGRNPLPLVLVEDVVAALCLAMKVEGIEGQSFNLVGDPMFSAREYLEAIRVYLGAEVDVSSASLLGLFVADSAKYFLKRYALNRTDSQWTSLKDWKSRAHLSQFSNAWSKERLGWSPVRDKTAFIEQAIVRANLFGY